MESSFQWNGATVFVTNTTVRTKFKKARLNRLINLDEITDELDVELAFYATFYLAHVNRVEGDLGFYLPNGDANEENVKTFIDAFSECDEAIVDLWDNAIKNARSITNDVDLLPPEEIDPNA